MIGSWARARRRPVPNLELANPSDAYRAPLNATVDMTVTVVTQTEPRRDPERDMAATVAEWFREDLARLARHTETMSPWEAATKALRDEERA